MAATVLNPGDIAIVGYISIGSNDSFSFVPLVDLGVGTEIYFTDNGWTGSGFRGSNASNGSGNEQLIKFTASNNISAGTVIRSSDESSSNWIWTKSGTIGTTTIGTYSDLQLAQGGDQIAAFQSTNTSNPLNSGITAIHQVDNTGTFEDATSASTGNVITALSQKDNTAVLFDTTLSKNAAFKLDTIPNGTRADWLAAINNPENWTFDTNISNLTTGSIQVISEISNAAPTIGNNTLLYDGGTGKSPKEIQSAPNAPWFDYQDNTALLGGSATATSQKDGIILKTDTDPQGKDASAGYTNYKIDQFGNLQARTNFPKLDRNLGYVVSFTSQIISENHNTPTSDKNGDGKADRAGFSVIAISEDKKGIELGFWENRIWAQEDGTEPTASNPNGTLFTQAEGVNFDTKTKVVKYDLAVKGNTYTLFANGNLILQGDLRDYTAFQPAPYKIGPLTVTPPDPYEKPSFLFFGDNTSSAKAEVKLSDIAVTTNSNKPSFFKVDENAVRGAVVGQVFATDPDGDTLSNWEIIDGNSDVDKDGKPAFAIDSTTGEITVNDADDLDFKNNPSFQLKVRVSDGINTSALANVTININDAPGVLIDETSVTNNRFKGSPGNDTINGGAGNDFLYGFAGNDSLTGGAGNDNLYGEAGRDTLIGGAGNDNLYGEVGNDTLIGSAGNDNLYGGQGDDSIDGGDGIDTLRETADVDFKLTNNQLTGLGTDSLVNIERVALTGGESANKIDASAFTGLAYLYGKGGNDFLTGGSGNDNLYGEVGDDTLIGGAGNDLIKGGEGNDLIKGGAGSDRLYGEAGSDIFVISSFITNGKDTIYDFDVDVDTIGLSGLSSSELNIQGSGNNTNILQGDNVLAVLANVNVGFNDITFTIIS